MTRPIPYSRPNAMTPGACHTNIPGSNQVGVSYFCNITRGEILVHRICSGVAREDHVGCCPTVPHMLCIHTTSARIETSTPPSSPIALSPAVPCTVTHQIIAFPNQSESLRNNIERLKLICSTPIRIFNV